MGTPELTRALKHAATIVFGLTAVGAVGAVIAPSLASSSRPHPTLTGSPADALSILANNLRVLVSRSCCGCCGSPTLEPGGCSEISPSA